MVKELERVLDPLHFHLQIDHLNRQEESALDGARWTENEISR